MLVTIFGTTTNLEFMLYGITIVALIVLGIVSAKAGGAGVGRAILRIVIWGTVAMGLSAAVGYIFGVNM